MFAKRLPVEEVARSVGRAQSTTFEYLADYIEQAKIDDPHPWVDRETFQRIEHAVRQTGGDRMKPVFELLNSEVPYDYIRVSMACIRNSG